MTCRCTTNTLRLFIRSIAQVDLNSAAAHGAPRQISRVSIPNFPSKGIQPQLSSRRAFSSTSAPLKNDDSSTGHAASESESGWQQGRSAVGSQSLGNSESAFVEFSLDAIDAIAAEAQPQPKKVVEEYETPLQILLKDAPKRKEETPIDPMSRTTIRRTKVENTSFALHYSNPRAPPSSQPSTNSSLRSSEERSRGFEKPRSEDTWTPQQREHWQKDKSSLEKKFPDGWRPLKKLSPDAISGIRALHAQFPERYTTEALAQEFEISPEAIRRILKSKWSPNSEEESDRHRRWFKRGEQVWSRWAEMGKKPPKQWRDLGIGKGKPEWLKRKQEKPKPLPALITHARRRDEKYGMNAVLRTRSKDGLDGLADKIL